MNDSPNDRRNRRGCFVILVVLLLFLGLYVLVGSSAEPGNSMLEKIPALSQR